MAYDKTIEQRIDALTSLRSTIGKKKRSGRVCCLIVRLFLFALLPTLLVTAPVPIDPAYAETALSGTTVNDEALDQIDAVQVTVRGTFRQEELRAAVFRLAIRHNLAGWDATFPDGTVRFLFQGHRSSIEQLVSEIPRAVPTGCVSGISPEKVPVSPELRTFTIRGWTSGRHGSAKPADLIFTLRSPDGPVSPKEASRIYQKILKKTMEKDSQF